MGAIFEGLFGNESTKARFAAMIKAETLPHAFLTVGPRGSGKRTLAYEISAALNCENRGSSLLPFPCRRCNTCRRIFDGSYTDIKELGKGDKASIGVDAVKYFKEDMFLTSTESEYKVYIINDAHTLTPQAQNALLTVMEEPPPRVVIFLLSEASDKILTTIKSRAQYIAMERFSRRMLDEYLTANVPKAEALKKSDKEQFEAVLMCSDGCIGRALSLLDKEKSAEAEREREGVKKFICSLDVKAPFSEIFSAAASLPDKRAELLPVMEQIISAVSDMIKARSGAEDFSTEFFPSGDEARLAARTVSLKRLFLIFDVLSEYYGYLSKNASVSAAKSSLAAKIKMI